MKTLKKLSIVIIIFSTLCCSSNDDSSNGDPSNGDPSKEEGVVALPTVKDIYVCGYEKRSDTGKLIATVWKNGVVTSLTDGTKNANASDIIVVGNDVYVAGSEEDNQGSRVARLWKNGLAISLTDNSPYVTADKIAVNGIDVYVKGMVFQNGKYQSKVWKNGIGLITTEGGVNGIAVNNKDFYAVGHENDKAKLWQNGIGRDLTSSNLFSRAYDVAIKDDDVYIVGTEVIGNISVARLWKNGIASNLSDGKVNALATAISITGKDVYIYGYETDGITAVKVWKNGEVIWSKENSTINDLKAVGQDYYMLSNTGHIAKILKNGVPHELTSAINSYGEAMFITTN